MKWFKKDSNARKHKVVKQGKAKFGKARFGLFFNNLLEVMAEFYRPQEPDCIEMAWSDFADEMEFNNPREKGIADPDANPDTNPDANQILFQMLSWLAAKKTIKIELRRVPELNYKYFLKLYYPSFQQRMDEYTRKMSGQTPDKSPDTTPDHRLEEEKEKNINTPPTPPEGDVGKKKKKKEKPVALEALPENVLADTRLNQKSLQEFFVFRRDEKKKPLTPMALKKAIDLLIKYNYAIQAKIVNKSIMNSWQGLFEPNKNDIVSTNDDAYPSSTMFDDWEKMQNDPELQKEKEKYIEDLKKKQDEWKQEGKDVKHETIEELKKQCQSLKQSICQKQKA